MRPLDGSKARTRFGYRYNPDLPDELSRVRSTNKIVFNLNVLTRYERPF